MASLTSIREGLAANVSTIDDVQGSAYVLSNPTPPCAEVEPAETEYDLAMRRGLDRWTLTVRVFVALANDIGAQKRLDLMLATAGAHSVKAALEADKTLAGACEDLRVTRCSGYRTFTRPAGGALLGAEWTVEVLARGDT